MDTNRLEINFTIKSGHVQKLQYPFNTIQEEQKFDRHIALLKNLLNDKKSLVYWSIILQTLDEGMCSPCIVPASAKDEEIKTCWRKNLILFKYSHSYPFRPFS